MTDAAWHIIFAALLIVLLTAALVIDRNAALIVDAISRVE